MEKSQYSYKRIWHIAYPILISLVMEQLIGMTDTAFLGRVGEVELGASAIAGIYYLIIFMLGFGFSVGAQIMIARRNGQGSFLEIGNIFYHGLYFLLIVAAVVCGLSLMFSPQILDGIVASKAVGDKAVSYINWRIFGLFFSFSAAMFRAFYVGTTQTKTLTLNSVIMVLSNVIFNYIFIFGKLGLPALGIAGAAIGSTLAEMISCLFFLIYTARRVDYRKYGLNKVVRFRWHELKMILNVSVWTMVQNFISIATWFLFFIFIEHLGERSLAVTNIIRNVSAIPFMIIMAFASTCSSIISNMIGAGNVGEVMNTIKKHVILAYSIVLPISAVFCLFPQLTVSVYTDIQELQLASINSLWVLCSSYIVTVPAFILFNSVSGTGNTKIAFRLEVTALAVYVVFITYVVFLKKSDVAICWVSEHVYSSMMLLLSYHYLSSGKWKYTKI